MKCINHLKNTIDGNQFFNYIPVHTHTSSIYNYYGGDVVGTLLVFIIFRLVDPFEETN